MRFDQKTFLDNDRIADILRKVVNFLYSISNNGITYKDNMLYKDVSITVNTAASYSGVFGDLSSIPLQTEFEVSSVRLLTAYLSDGTVVPSQIGFTWHPNGKTAVIDMIYGLQANKVYTFTWRIE